MSNTIMKIKFLVKKDNCFIYEEACKNKKENIWLFSRTTYFSKILCLYFCLFCWFVRKIKPFLELVIVHILTFCWFYVVRSTQVMQSLVIFKRKRKLFKFNHQISDINHCTLVQRTMFSGQNYRNLFLLYIITKNN